MVTAAAAPEISTTAPAININTAILRGGPLWESDYDSLAKSGIDRATADGAYLRRVDALGGGEIIGRSGNGDWAGVSFPYFLPGEDHVRAYRLRLDRPGFEERGNGGYRDAGKYLGAPEA